MPVNKEKSLLFKLDCENTIEQFNFDYVLKTQNLKISYKFKEEAKSFLKYILNEMHQNLLSREMNGCYECKIEMKYKHVNEKGFTGLSFNDISKVAMYEEVQLNDFQKEEVVEEFLEIALDIQQQYLDSQMFVF